MRQMRIRFARKDFSNERKKRAELPQAWDRNLQCMRTFCRDARRARTPKAALLTCLPHRAPNVYSTLRYFLPRKPCTTPQCACDCSAHRSLTAALVKGPPNRRAPVANDALGGASASAFALIFFCFPKTGKGGFGKPVRLVSFRYLRAKSVPQQVCPRRGPRLSAAGKQNVRSTWHPM